MSVTEENTQSETRVGRRWVFKLGSAIVSGSGPGLAESLLDTWVAQLAALRKQGDDLVIVSSGAVAAGMKRLNWQQRPHALEQLQAAAAVGQASLVEAWQSRFQQHQLHTAQILLVHADLSSRTRYLNARQTLKSLLGHGVIPVVNENDSVATDEIRFGDNDTLAGLVANLVEADRLVIMTDQDGVFSDDPRRNPAATLIEQCDVHDPMLDQVAKGSGGQLGRGGMATKLNAARLAARSGAQTHIVSGLGENVIQRLAAGERIGTQLTCERQPVAARKQWLAGGLSVRGSLQLDDGAIKVLTRSGRSLLPVGVTAVEGIFARGELVTCVDASGREIARGLVNYSSDEASKLLGKPSSDIEDLLGYGGDAELIHRDNLVITAS